MAVSKCHPFFAANNIWLSASLRWAEARRFFPEEQTRIASGRLSTRIEAFDLRQLAVDIIEELGRDATDKGLELRLESAENVDLLESDDRLVRLILVNLVSNAIKFTEAGSIVVALGTRSGHHVMTVLDTGAGIPVEEQERIFEPFVLLDTISHKHRPGLGLGLALVKQLVSALGGTIDLSSAEGIGSTFTVRVPSRSVPAQGEDLLPPV